MRKSHLAAYQKAFQCKVSNVDLDVGLFIMTAHTLPFFESAKRWMQTPPIGVAHPQKWQSACRHIVTVIESGYNEEQNEWWHIRNFKVLASLQIDLAAFGVELESFPANTLEWRQLKRDFIAFIEIFCGLNWREQAAKFKKAIAALPVAA